MSGHFACPDMGKRLFRASLVSPVDVFQQTVVGDNSLRSVPNVIECLWESDISDMPFHMDC